MDNKVFLEKWSTLLPKIKQKWSKLTDQDLKQINGEKSKFLSQLQQKYGIDKNTAEQELRKLAEPLASAGARPGSAPQKGGQPQAKQPYKK